jgi:hypothetical protein
MGDVSVQQVGNYDWSRTTSGLLYDDMTGDRLHAVRAAGGRVAQEAVSVTAVMHGPVALHQVNAEEPTGNDHGSKVNAGRWEGRTTVK